MNYESGKENNWISNQNYAKQLTDQRLVPYY